MKIRIKFEKDGVMRYIGHLDIMRYFQKSMRRAEVDICYSTGFSPHQIMSFAAPLGVGHISYGEYFDIEVHSHNGAKDMLDRLNAVMVPGIRIASVKLLPDKAGNAMASVAAARYLLEPKENAGQLIDFASHSASFLSQEAILVKKQTKKQEITMDIKPHIYEWIPKGNSVEIFVDASSSGNIKPTLALEAYCDFCGAEFDPLAYQIIRLDTYLNAGTDTVTPVFKPLDSAGEDF